MKTHTVQLGEACEFIRGVTFDKAEATTHPEIGKTPILRAGNIGDDLEMQNDLVWVPDGRVSDYQRLRKNDIAICMSSGSTDVVGKTARVPCNLRASIGSFCGIIRPKNFEQASYLSFFFRSRAFRKHCDAIARGANIQNLRFSQFDKIQLEIPTEQQQIALRLEQANRLRRTRRYALELSDTFLRSVFVEMFGESFSRCNSERTLGNLVTITGGGTPSRDRPEFFEGENPWLTAKDMIDDYIRDTQEHITEEAIGSSATKLIPAKSVLVVVKSKVLMHRLPLAITEISLCHGQDIKSIQCSAGIVPEFVKFSLHHYERKLLNWARGANTEGLTLPMLRELPIPIVSLQTQQRFAHIVHTFKRLRSMQRESSRLAEHLFQTLLHQAFAGESSSDSKALPAPASA